MDEDIKLSNWFVISALHNIFVVTTEMLSWQLILAGGQLSEGPLWGISQSVVFSSPVLFNAINVLLD